MSATIDEMQDITRKKLISTRVKIISYIIMFIVINIVDVMMEGWSALLRNVLLFGMGADMWHSIIVASNGYSKRFLAEIESK